jgi:hypothetical protein
VGTGHLPTGLPLEGKLVAVEGDLSPPPTSPSRTMSRGRSASLEAVLGNAAGEGACGGCGQAVIVMTMPRGQPVVYKQGLGKGKCMVDQMPPGSRIPIMEAP